MKKIERFVFISPTPDFDRVVTEYGCSLPHLKSKAAYASDYATSDQRAPHLSRWLHQYNWRRLHTSFGYRPPITRIPLALNNVLGLYSVGHTGDNVNSKHLQRIVLISFVVTFTCARILVLLIMSRDIPSLYLHLGGTHVHHLNYGIFLLSFVGATLLFARPPSGRWLDLVAIFYGIGLALTFDEFGMWLHLGGSYWQRASFDAITVVCGALVLAAYTPPIKRWDRRTFAWTVVLLCLLCTFFWRLSLSLPSIERKLEDIERHGPF